jgi:Protein of unknown function (DUF2695)
MSLGLMTPIHPRWDEFMDALEGPAGCNFRETIPPDSTWDCDNTPHRPIARRILRRMGGNTEEIDQSLGYFNAFGGHCDCEIAFNVEDSFNDFRGVRPKPRSRTAKNPVRRKI